MYTLIFLWSSFYGWRKYFPPQFYGLGKSSKNLKLEQEINSGQTRGLTQQLRKNPAANYKWSFVLIMSLFLSYIAVNGSPSIMTPLFNGTAIPGNSSDSKHARMKRKSLLLGKKKPTNSKPLDSLRRFSLEESEIEMDVVNGDVSYWFFITS